MTVGDISLTKICPVSVNALENNPICKRKKKKKKEKKTGIELRKISSKFVFLITVKWHVLLVGDKKS